MTFIPGRTRVCAVRSISRPAHQRVTSFPSPASGSASQRRKARAASSDAKARGCRSRHRGRCAYARRICASGARSSGQVDGPGQSALGPYVFRSHAARSPRPNTVSPSGQARCHSGLSRYVSANLAAGSSWASRANHQIVSTCNPHSRIPKSSSHFIKLGSPAGTKPSGNCIRTSGRLANTRNTGAAPIWNADARAASNRSPGNRSPGPFVRSHRAKAPSMPADSARGKRILMSGLEPNRPMQNRMADHPSTTSAADGARHKAALQGLRNSAPIASMPRIRAPRKRRERSACFGRDFEKCTLPAPLWRVSPTRPRQSSRANPPVYPTVSAPMRWSDASQATHGRGAHRPS